MVELRYIHNGREYVVNMSKKGELGEEGFVFNYSGKEYKLKAARFKENFYSIELDDKRFKAVVSKKEDTYHVFINGRIYQLLKASPTQKRARKGNEREDNKMRSPISGRVVKVLVEEGQRVEKGQEIMVIEAMKMEHTITAPYNGTVEKVLFKKGEQVEIREELVKIKKEEEK